MRNILYICNAKQPTMVNNTYEYRNLRILLCSSVNSLGCLATISKGVRSLFVQRKLVTQMPNNNKQATKAKNSNLYAHITDILVALSAIVIGLLLLIYAPDILMVIGKFLACVALVAMVVVPAIYAFTWKPSKPYEKY